VDDDLDDLDDLRVLLPGARLAHLEQLGGSNRSVVRRVSADAGTLIVKRFVSSDEGWVRESAALSVLPPGAPAPRLVAASGTAPVVVMTDLGTGTSVADALLGDDASVAAEAVVSWATAVATLHRVTAGSREAFRVALRARSGELPVAESTVATDLDDAGRIVAECCAQLGVEVPAGALAELHGLADRLGGDASAALTPADACPDNNVRVADGLALIDFEGAQWRHVAWDVAYLLVPWASCWCAWRIPDEVAQRGIAAYRDALGWAYPDTAGFRDDVAAAAVGWALISTSWFLRRALVDDTPIGSPDHPAPSRRATIQHRLDGARRGTVLPALAELAGRLYEALAARWGETALAYAPAFAPDVTARTPDAS